MDLLETRRRVLESCGADAATADELIGFGDARFQPLPPRPVRLPLEDEPHVEAWRRYLANASACGVVPELRSRFVQLQFPVQEGISRDSAYREATLSGAFHHAIPFQPGLVFESPEAVGLDVCPSMAGAVPVITAGARADFVALVRAFTERNEPADVPASVGACIVAGLNNWDRIARHKQAWAERGGEVSGSWNEEFRRLAATKAAYQDRLVILSRGPYSDLPASETGYGEAEWLDRSLVIRREHECTHYFVYRLCGVLRQTILDELLADFVGFVRGCGAYRVDLARKVLGIEACPAFRPGGRLEYYQRHRPLSPAAFDVLVQLAWRASANMSHVWDACSERLGTLDGLATAVHAMGALTLEEAADDRMPDVVVAAC